MTATHTPGPGDVLGGCRLDRLVAQGGMGMVYEATHLALGRRVAVKIIAPQLAHDPEFRERFEREARLTARLHHPNVVDVHDAGEQDDVLYLVMRFVDGIDLRTLLQGGQRLAPARTVTLVGQIADALDAAHTAGLIHRDVTPSNILISGKGSTEQAALTDFGLVKHIDTAGLTRTGAWFGTLAYVAPEALRDETIDARADIYALGCLLHRMLTGETPFPRESDAAVIAAHLTDPPPRPSATRGVPAGLDAVVARALAKQPGDRFASAGALAAAAREALTAAPETPAGTAPTQRRAPGDADMPTRVAPAPAPAPRASSARPLRR
ncbi:MAG: protein kinase, partial [Actinobacteria bacterium]|nr:protein kinase [Actinomycetota bacterium]